MGEYNRRSERGKLKALERNKALWDHYNAHDILLLSDFKRLTGGQYRAVMDTFNTYGLQPPPVYDSRSEKYKRMARRLGEGAAELGQDHLTISQAAKILNTKPSRVIGIEGRLLRAGCMLPDIIMDETRAMPISREEENEFALRFHGTCNPLYYPPGLQVLKYWPGPGESEITYLLR